MRAENLRLVLCWAGVVIFLLLEPRIAYRSPSVPKFRCWPTNIPLSIVNAGVDHLLDAGLIAALLAGTDAGRYGLLNALAIPFGLRVALGVLILGLAISVWHLLNLVVPLVASRLFEMPVSLSIQFHPSDIRVLHAFEQWRVLLFTPPFLHRIHHSVKIRERDSNYGVILSVWGRPFGTMTTDVDQGSITTGIGSHRNFDSLGFWNLWLAPFARRSR